MKNYYEIRGDVTAILFNSPKYGPMEALIDTCDLPRAQEFPNKWYVAWDGRANTFYVTGKIMTGGKRTSYYLHRFLTQCPKNLYVDHINHNGLDNRRSCNLRVVTSGQNLQNRRGATRANKSSCIRGVTWDKSNKKWVAYMTIDGKNKHLGRFNDLEQARIIAEKARAEHMPFDKSTH